MSYTYLAINKVTGKFYYGAKYSTGCSENDLWSTYFTSSKSVKKDVELFGKENFHVEVRKKFNSVEDCLRWEYKVLRRMKAKERPDCYNLTNGGSVFDTSKRMIMNNPMHEKSSVEKMVKSKQILRDQNLHKSTANKEETKKLTSERMKTNNPMTRLESLKKMVETRKVKGDGCTGTTWMANPFTRKRKRVRKELVDKMIESGWMVLSNRLPIPEACQ